MRQHRKKKDFNDLLIPIILILAVLPFVTRLIIYESGLSGYAWFSDNDIVTDFFSYYKSNAFLIISIVSAIILVFYFTLGRQYIKDMKPFLLIGIYALFIIVSTIFSTDVSISMIGGTGHFESAIVLLGYLIMMVYAYQIDKKEKDYRAILKSLVLSLILMCMIGTFQMFGQDLISFPWFQKIIIPREFWRDYVG
ncbi:MAG: hypothetical protein K0S76_3251, partial [Herbinix sp.]|nr:hypothetical protein [Herbinix sp.]